jgi:hypothetical protein
MNVEIPSTEPSVINAGDTISWTKSLPDYLPSDGWSLSYAFRFQHGAGGLDLIGIQSGAVFSSTIPAASSNAMQRGLWNWAAYVTLGADRHQVAAGILTVKPNLATINDTTDLRTSAKKAYDNALAAWEGVKLGQTVILNGRTYTQHNLKDLIVFVDRCKADYVAERQAEQMAQTGINPRHIGVRLTRV